MSTGSRRRTGSSTGRRGLKPEQGRNPHMKRSTRFVKFAVTTCLLLTCGAIQPLVATAQQTAPAAAAPFSFIAYGDSRPMMNIPSSYGRPEVTKLLAESFGIILSEKTAEEIVQKNVKMTFDPVTKELIQLVMPFITKSEVTTLKVNKGWVTEATVEDTKLLPGVHRTMFRLGGGDWVTREIVKDVQSGRAKFVVNAGDVVWWGNQGRTVHDSPYWQRINENLFKLLPPPDSEMRAAGLEGRWFVGLGNHEVQGDP